MLNFFFCFKFENEDMYQNIPISERPNPPELQRSLQPTMLPDEKFKGFEEFLDIENEKDISVPNSI